MNKALLPDIGQLPEVQKKKRKKDDLHDLKIAELFKAQIDGKFAEL